MVTYFCIDLQNLLKTMKKLFSLASILAILALSFTGCSSLQDQWAAEPHEKYYEMEIPDRFHPVSEFQVVVYNDTQEVVYINGENGWPHFTIKPMKQVLIQVRGRDPKVLLTAMKYRSSPYFKDGESWLTQACPPFEHNFKGPDIVPWHITDPHPEKN